MAGAAILAVRIIADASKARAELDKTGKATSKFGNGLNKAAGVAAVGMGALAAFTVGGVKAASEDAQAQVVLANTLKKSAGATDDAVASTEDWIAKTSLASGVADDDLRPALGALVRATGDTAKAQDALSTALDISAATGKDVKTVSEALAKGYAGNTKGLGKLGLGIDKATLATGDMGKIMDAVNAKVGGASAAAADTAAGRFQRMKVAIGETQESLGSALVPALGALLAILQPILATLSQNTQLVVILAGAFAALGSVILIAAAAQKVMNAYTTISTAVQKGAALATKAWALATRLLSAAWAASPIGLIILAVVGLVAVIILAYKHSATFRRIVQAAFAAVQKAAQAVWSWLKANWPLLLAILLGPFGPVVLLVIKNLDKIKKAFSVVMDAIRSAISPVVDAIQGLWDMIKKVIDLLGKIKVPKIKLPFGLGKAAPAVPTPAPAVATGRGAARVGRATDSTSSASTVNVYALDPQQTARLVQRLVHTADIRAGRKRFA
jgi:hypothetical protein